jgi:ABC-type antimicrobial peptide transport system permease subunit
LCESVAVVSVGVAVGVPVAIIITRLVSSMLFGLSPQDPTTIAVALAVLMLVSVVAAYLPARNAARTDPLLALREE